MPTGQTALILPVPQAEALVGAWRARFDKHAAQGVPAHITLLSPFLPPDQALAALPQVRHVLGPDAPRFSLTGLHRWPGLAVLCPEPDRWFQRVMAGLCQAFHLLPYGGRYGDVPEPHLTVAYGADDPRTEGARFQAIAQDVSAHLPLACNPQQVQLLQRRDQRWEVLARLELRYPSVERRSTRLGP